MNQLKSVFNWPFMQEPLYRWFMFLIAITIFSAVWSCILQYMKD